MRYQSHNFSSYNQINQTHLTCHYYLPYLLYTLLPNLSYNAYFFPLLFIRQPKTIPSSCHYFLSQSKEGSKVAAWGSVVRFSVVWVMKLGVRDSWGVVVVLFACFLCFKSQQGIAIFFYSTQHRSVYKHENIFS